MIAFRRIGSTVLLLVSLLLTACSGRISGGDSSHSAVPRDTETAAPADPSAMLFSFTDREKDAGYNDNGATKITLSDNDSTVDGFGAVVSGNEIIITAEGTYVLSGTLTDGSVTVRAGIQDKIQLVLNGVSIAASDRPALYIAQADKVFLTLLSDTENDLTDGSSYTQIDGESTLDAALFSREDLVINGSGTLTVQGRYKHGIVSKDDLVVTGGMLKVTAQNVGMNGKDCVKIGGGVLTIEAGTDGIRSDNEEEASRGYVYIADGDIAITAGNDGIQAQTVLRIAGGRVNLTTGGGSANASTNRDGSYNPGWGGGWGRPGDPFGGNNSASSQTESAKGLKSYSLLTILGGDIVIDSSDDSLHANGSIEISDGCLTLRSGDDGAHANAALTISGGTLTLHKSYEGLESTAITIAGGIISVVASDDGLNAAGGKDGSSIGGRPGMGMFESSTGSIVISGGYLAVDAAGDGIDANGDFSISGGVVLVSGPTNGGNGAFDYASSAKVTGGTLIAVGSSGMAQSFSEADGQGAIFLETGNQSAGTSLALCDRNGVVLAAFTPAKAYQTAVLTAQGVEKGGEYTIVIGGTVSNADANGYAAGGTVSGGTILKEIAMSSELYGSAGSGFGGGMGGGRPR